MSKLQDIINNPNIIVRRKILKIGKIPFKLALEKLIFFYAENPDFLGFEKRFANLMSKKLNGFYYPFGNKGYHAESIPEDFLKKYVPKETISFEAGRIIQKRTNYSVTLFSSNEKEKDKTKLIYFEQNKEGKFPTLVIFPIYSREEPLSYFLSVYFSNKGYNSLIIKNPREIYDEDIFCGDIENSLEKFVSKNIQIIDWLSAKDKIDSGKICGFGASCGGVILSMLASLDRRLKYSTIALAGAPFSELFINSIEKGISKKINKWKKESGLSIQEIKQRLSQAIKTDPLYLAKYTNPANILFISTAYDNVVPKINQDKLWNAMGRPERLILPADHYSAAKYLPYLTVFVRKFYERKLEDGI